MDQRQTNSSCRFRAINRDVPVLLRQHINCGIVHLGETDGHIEREALEVVKKYEGMSTILSCPQTIENHSCPVSATSCAKRLRFCAKWVYTQNSNNKSHASFEAQITADAVAQNPCGEIGDFLRSKLDARMCLGIVCADLPVSLSARMSITCACRIVSHLRKHCCAMSAVLLGGHER